MVNEDKRLHWKPLVFRAGALKDKIDITTSLSLVGNTEQISDAGKKRITFGHAPTRQFVYLYMRPEAGRFKLLVV
jgi:hypothetical protein